MLLCSFPRRWLKASQPTKVKVVGTFHVPSTWNPGKCLTANGTSERACTFLTANGTAERACYSLTANGTAERACYFCVKATWFSNPTGGG